MKEVILERKNHYISDNENNQRLTLQKTKRYSGYYMITVIQVLLYFILLLGSSECLSQNQKIKCYFNYPVNTVISTGANAVYLNGTFDDTVAAYINRAKYTIDIAMYNYTSTAGSIVAKIATAANSAVSRGVIVRWIYNGSSTNSGLTLLSPSINTIASPTSSGYGIMHNKFMVIDANSADLNDPVVMTGSFNFSVTQTTGDYNNIVFIQDKPVALAYYEEFNKMWGGTGPSPNLAFAAFGINKTASAQNVFYVNGTMVEVYFSPKDPTGQGLKDAINTVNDDLFFGIYTFTDNSIANLIKDKYNSGIAVRGIMDQYSKNYTTSTNTPYYILSPVLQNNFILYTTSLLYHNKIMLVDALNPTSDPQVFTGSFNWSLSAQNSNDENAVIIHDAAIANQYYQSLCQNFTDMGGMPCNADPCPASTTLISSNLRGTVFQWQVNSGSGFTNLFDNVDYTGTTSSDLLINNALSSWYGYQYRCIVDGNYSDTTTLKFTCYWNGSTNTAWENPLNWNCGKLPDANTDVVINSGIPFYPVINSNKSCRSVDIRPGATIKVITGFNLLLTGH